MTNKEKAPDKYQSKGKTISRSMSHEGMWIIDHGKTWHNLTTDDATILKLHPKDKR